MIAKTFVETDTTDGFLNPTRTEENGIVDHIDITNLDAATQYFVRAGVTDDQGNIIYSENTYNFTTTAAGPNYFYIQNMSNNSNMISLTKIGTPTTGTTLEYLLYESIGWVRCNYDSNNICHIELAPMGSMADKVYFRSSDGFSQDDSDYYKFDSSYDIAAGGDLRTLLDYTNENLHIATSYGFYMLFGGNSNLVVCIIDFSKLTTLASNCYRSMFQGCVSLTTAPDLPATNLASGCYWSMFQGCTSITTTPDLPATNLASSCYLSMFNGCSLLNRVVTYAQDISASNCLRLWLYNVSATGDFYNLGGATYPSDPSGIPSGWTEHTSL